MPTTKIYIQSPNYSLVLSQPRYAFNVQSPNYSIVLKQPRYGLSLARGTQGVPGPPGPPGGSSVIVTAGETLSAGRVVIMQANEAFYFQPSDSSHSGRAFGVTLTSATAGNTVTVQISGEATDASFASFGDVPLYVIADGELSTTWPATGLLQKAAIGTGTNKIKIDFSIQIQQS